MKMVFSASSRKFLESWNIFRNINKLHVPLNRSTCKLVFNLITLLNRAMIKLSSNDVSLIM